MGAGAMLVGIAWRVSGGRPPLALMATDAFGMALSTFVGCVTGSVTWLHIVVLCLWAADGAGCWSSLGNRGGVVGNAGDHRLRRVRPLQRARRPGAGPGHAACSPAAWPRWRSSASCAGRCRCATSARPPRPPTARWPRWRPPPTRPRRCPPPQAHRRGRGQPGLPHPVRRRRGHDAAQPGQRGLPAARAAHGHPRAAAPAARRGRRTEAASDDSPARRALALAAGGAEHRRAGDRGRRGRGRARCSGARPSSTPTVAGLRGRGPGSPRAAHGPPAGRAGRPGPRRRRRWHPPRARAAACASRRPYARARNRRCSGSATDLEQLRANMSLDSPAGRHALRLAVVVPLAERSSRASCRSQRSYWMVVAAATILRPEFGATFTRGAERALGTCLGVGAGRRHRRHPAPGGRASPSCSSASWPGSATRCFRPASRWASPSSPRWWCS